jgi:integrase
MRILGKERGFLTAQPERRENSDDTTIDSPFVFPNRLQTKYPDAPITHIRKVTGRIWRALKTESFSAHDLRRACATKLGQRQILGHVIARKLNHRQTDVTSAIYNQYGYLKEKREALNYWGARPWPRLMSGSLRDIP